MLQLDPDLPGSCAQLLCPNIGSLHELRGCKDSDEQPIAFMRPTYQGHQTLGARSKYFSSPHRSVS